MLNDLIQFYYTEDFFLFSLSEGSFISRAADMFTRESNFQLYKIVQIKLISTFLIKIVLFISTA